MILWLTVVFLNLSLLKCTHRLVYKTLGWPGQITHALPPRLLLTFPVCFMLPTYKVCLTCKEPSRPDTWRWRSRCWLQDLSMARPAATQDVPRPESKSSAKTQEFSWRETRKMSSPGQALVSRHSCYCPNPSNVWIPLFRGLMDRTSTGYWKWHRSRVYSRWLSA